MSTIDLLMALSRVHPRIWHVVSSPDLGWPAGAAVALNPQPLPPDPPPDVYIDSAARATRHVLAEAMSAEVVGDSGVDMVRRFVEDWCGTPWPWPFPWPWPGPRPNEGPLPDPWQVASARSVGAVILASVGSRLRDGDLRDVCLEGAERLAEAASLH